jgi:hypothetical protein
VTNPYAPLPTTTASSDAVSGGGADGNIDHVVALCLQRISTRANWPVGAQADAPHARQFDLAELISQCAATAGTTVRLPGQADALWRLCRDRRTTITVAEALATKGAVLFEPGSCALSLGVRARVVMFSQRAGVVLATAAARPWTAAALIPGARGYR